MIEITESELKRFIDKVVFIKDGHWIYTGYPGHAYGRFHYHGINVLAHRLSYQIFIGDLKPEDLVLHRCDIPRCVCPECLFVGTPTSNGQDAALKKRVFISNSSRRTSNQANLTDVQIREIRALYGNPYSEVRGPISFEKIGRMYDITAPAVRRIVLRIAYSHVT